MSAESRIAELPNSDPAALIRRIRDQAASTGGSLRPSPRRRGSRRGRNAVTCGGRERGSPRLPRGTPSRGATSAILGRRVSRGRSCSLGSRTRPWASLCRFHPGELANTGVASTFPTGIGKRAETAPSRIAITCTGVPFCRTGSTVSC